MHTEAHMQEIIARVPHSDRRLAVLTVLTDAVLARHAEHLATIARYADSNEFTTTLDHPLDVSPAAAIAHVLHEVEAYWSVEMSFIVGPHTAADHAEILTGTLCKGRELVPVCVASAIGKARRAASLAS